LVVHDRIMNNSIPTEVRFGSNAERLVLSISRLLRSHTGHAADGTPPPNPRYCGRGFLKQFKPLAAHGKLEEVEPGHVAAGPGKVGDEALADRIGDLHE
jgi:hypothetical protein